MNSITNTPTYQAKSSQSDLSGSWLTSILFTMLEKLVHGQLIIQEGSNTRTFGSDSSLRAHVTINDSRAYRKILFGGSIGAGEAGSQCRPRSGLGRPPPHSGSAA